MAGQEDTVKCLYSLWQTTKDFSDKYGDNVIKPAVTTLGVFPFIGNFANFGSALHAYYNGETRHGHQKMAETIVGTSIDLMTSGSTTGGLKLVRNGLNNANANLVISGVQMTAQNLAQHTATRVAAFELVGQVLNAVYPDYYK